MSGCLPQVPRPPGRLPPPFRIGASLASQEPPNPSPRTFQLDLSQGPVHSPAQPHVPPVRHSLGSIPLKRDGNRSRGENRGRGGRTRPDPCQGGFYLIFLHISIVLLSTR